MMHMHTSTDTAPPARARRRGHGGGDPPVDLVICPLANTYIMILALADARLGEMRQFMTNWFDDKCVVTGVFHPRLARKFLRGIRRPYGLHIQHRDGDDELLVLATPAQRRAIIDRLVAHVH
jgi:hypothetical protein